MVFKMGIALVDPVQQDGILWKTGYAIRVVQDLIAPHEHSFSAGGAVSVQLFHIFKVQVQAAFLFGGLLILSHPQLKRFIHVDIDTAGGGDIHQSA